MKKLLYITFGFVLLQMFFISCNDFIETDIEGQWQLQKVVYGSGEEHRVDTVFYSFKKNVFRYLVLASKEDGDIFSCFGNYKIDGSRISIKVEESTFIPWQYADCFDWETLSREFVIKKHKNNILELNLGDTLYVLRKY